MSHIPELNEAPLKKYYDTYYQPIQGRIHDKKPFKLKCSKGKIYYWCVCGWSHDQVSFFFIFVNLNYISRDVKCDNCYKLY